VTTADCTSATIQSQIILVFLMEENTNKTGGSGEATSLTAVCVFNISVHLVHKEMSSWRKWHPHGVSRMNFHTLKKTPMQQISFLCRVDDETPSLGECQDCSWWKWWNCIPTTKPYIQPIVAKGAVGICSTFTIPKPNWPLQYQPLQELIL
jgi:hypothetical protein